MRGVILRMIVVGLDRLGVGLVSDSYYLRSLTISEQWG